MNALETLARRSLQRFFRPCRSLCSSEAFDRSFSSSSDVPSNSAQQPTSLHAFRLHNSSLPYLQGQVVKGRVLSVSKHSVLIDPGYKQPQRFFKEELRDTQVVGEDGVVRAGVESMRVGDTINFVIEDLETPFGEMLLNVKKVSYDQKRRYVWEELKKHMQEQRPVMGRILNPVNRGYAVGIGGLVCFCPFSDCSPKAAARVGKLVVQYMQYNYFLGCCLVGLTFGCLGQVGVLQPFRIQSMKEEKRNVVVEALDFQRRQW
jgi:ribosomal protein S1